MLYAARRPHTVASRILARVQTLTEDSTRTRRWTTVTPWLSLVARLGLAAVWLIAGLTKVGDIDANVRSVRAYRLLPETAAQIVGSAQPFMEIALGVLLLLGLGSRIVAVISALGMLLFIGGIASAAARGLQIDCGCFSAGGDLAAGQQTQYTGEILRDTGFFVLSAFLCWKPRSTLSLDAALFPPLDLETE